MAKTLLSIARILDGKMPASMCMPNIMRRDNGEVIMVDLAKIRYNIKTPKGKADFLKKVLKLIRIYRIISSA